MSALISYAPELLPIFYSAIKQGCWCFISYIDSRWSE